MVEPLGFAVVLEGFAVVPDGFAIVPEGVAEPVLEVSPVWVPCWVAFTAFAPAGLSRGVALSALAAIVKAPKDATSRV